MKLLVATVDERCSLGCVGLLDGYLLLVDVHSAVLAKIRKELANVHPCVHDKTVVSNYVPEHEEAIVTDTHAHRVVHCTADDLGGDPDNVSRKNKVP